MRKVLITCPPMLRRVDGFRGRFAECRWDVATPAVVQTLTVPDLVSLVPQYDGWIIGDDPACAQVVEAGALGRLKAAVKWGAGVDNVDFNAFARAGIPVVNTPGMFGNEVADIALGYVIGLSRHTFEIHTEVLRGGWPKPAGVSLAGKTAGVVGFGYVGQQMAARLKACGVLPLIYDPIIETDLVANAGFESATWPKGLERVDFLVLCCALTASNVHMLNEATLHQCKRGVRIVNVARGGLIDEEALIRALEHDQVAACALDVFETEPLPASSLLRKFPNVVFGTHNSSNTVEAVDRTSFAAVDLLQEMLEAGPVGREEQRCALD
jgi:D-3-phosphoglycerate dehydrogenase